jgi:hypothetical protein
MTSPAWPRPHYRGAGGRPRLWFKVHGTFDEVPTVALPDGVDLFRYDRDEAPAVLAFGVDGPLADSLGASGVAAPALAAPHALVVRGELDDSPGLDYLRAVVVAIAALLDAGGVAVLDRAIPRWWSPADWRRVLVDPGAPVPLAHTAIAVVDDARHPGQRWFRTRGLATFGRPDVSMRAVAPEHEAGAAAALARLARLMADGAVIAHGKPVRLAGLPAGLRCFRAGPADDAELDDEHVELRRPRPADVFADVGGHDLAGLLAPWRWLGLGTPAVVAATLLGDLVLEDDDGAIYLLDTALGQVRPLAGSRPAFLASDDDALIDDGLAAGIAFDAIEAGLAPGPGQCLTYKVPPILGGEHELGNLELAELDVHQYVMAQVLAPTDE